MSLATTTANYNTYLRNLNNRITDLFTIVSTSIGVPLNLFMIFIFVRLHRRHKNNNMGFLYICQCIVDLILFMFNLLLYRSSPLIFPSTLANQSNAMCKLITYLHRYTIHISAWMPVLITFDRFIFVLNKPLVKIMKNRLYLSAIIAVMFTLIAIADIANLFYYLNNNTYSFFGARSCLADIAAVISSDLISVLIRTFIPFSLMVVFNGMMLWKIRVSSRTSFKMNNQNRKEYQFTVAVIAFNIYFLAANLPESIFFFFYDANAYSGAFSVSSVYRTIYNMLGDAFLDFSLLEQTFSFVMIFSFNKIFRKEVFYVFRRALAVLTKNRVHPDIFTTSSNNQQNNTNNSTQNNQLNRTQQTNR